MSETLPERTVFCRSFLPERTSQLVATIDQNRLIEQQRGDVERTCALNSKILPGREDLLWFLKLHQDATQFQHFMDTREPVNNAPFQTDRFCGRLQFFTIECAAFPCVTGQQPGK